MSEIGSSARARLIRTRRGTWVDESLFPVARSECLDILEQVACDSREDGVVEMLRGYRERLDGYPLGDLLRESGIASPEFKWLNRFDLSRR